MAPNKTKNRAVAISAAVGVSLLGVSACTSAVEGSASYAGGGPSSSSKSSSESSTSSSEPSSSSGESSSSTAGGGGSGPQDASDAEKAPDNPFKYKNGVEVKLGVPTPKEYSLLLSGEEGREFPVTVTNPSASSIDMSSYRPDSSVWCGTNYGNEEYIFSSEPETGPVTLAAGATGNYAMPVGVKKADIGSECVVSIVFQVEGVSSTDVTPAKFVITVS